MSHEYDNDEAQQEILLERRKYQENLSRSEEEGWFYPDHDGDGE